MSGFTVDFVCPVGFKHLAAEISYQRQLICRIKSERADLRLEVDFFFDYREPLEPLVLPLEEFIDLINELKAEVADLRARGAEEQGAE
jgi:hypothetical protein